MHDISEENLWLLCLNGDRDAFKEMYCRFYSLLYYYGLKLVSDKELVKGLYTGYIHKDHSESFDTFSNAERKRIFN